MEATVPPRRGGEVISLKLLDVPFVLSRAGRASQAFGRMTMFAVGARVMKFICALALVAASGSVIECQSREELAARIQALEARVVTLEQRIAALEGARSNIREGATGAPSTSSDLSQDLTNWRRLRRGMTMDQVRRILGEPRRISGGIVTYWEYVNGRVEFLNDRLSAWTEP